MRLRAILAALVVTLIAASASAQPYSPPTGSPAADGEWPRLIVTADNRAAIRTYIDTYYDTEFQAFLDRLADPTTQVDTIEGVYAPMNFAFPVALGVADLKTLGYTFPAAYDTDAELCAAGYAYATTDVGAYPSQVKQLQNSVAFDNNYVVGSTPNRVSLTDFIVPAMLLFDWCHATLSTAEKGVLADAFYEQYDENYDTAALSPNTLLNAGQGQTLSNRFDGVWSSLLFGLTSWGDTDVLDSTKRQALYDAFYTLYISRHLWEIDWSNGKAGFREGMDYWSHTNSMMVYEYAMIDTAIGRNDYVGTREFFTKRNQMLAAWVYPDVIGLTTSCGTGGATRCRSYVQPWGNNSITQTSITGLSQTHNVALTVGFARFMGFSDDANVGRWIWNNIVVNTNPTYAATDSPTSGLFTGYPWAFDVLYLFLFGIEGTTATTPTATAVHTMWDYYIFRSGYTTDASHVFFGASTHHSSGHESQENGSFSLFKQGNLITPGPQYRGSGCSVALGGTGGQHNIARNNVGIHSGASDASLGYDVLVSDPDWSARGLSANMNGPIALTPLTSTGTAHSYVQYDADPAWSQASVMQREFTYLRGATDHEYLVILDRANVADTANDPIWKIWVPRQPACVDASCVAGRAGQWTSTGKVLSVTNEHAALTDTNGWVLPATDAKMFVKSLLPTDATFNILGDDGTFGKMYQTGNNNGDLIAWEDATPTCDAGTQDLFGWGRIEIRPGTVGTTNTFLTVIQFGDADTLTAMTASVVAQTFTPGWIVAHVADAAQERIVGFAEDITRTGIGPRYAFAQTTTTASHLVVNLRPGRSYFVQSERPTTALVAPVGVLTVPVLAWPFLRRRRRIRAALAVLALVAVVGLARWAATLPVTMTVSVSAVPNGGVEHVADDGGVITFETER